MLLDEIRQLGFQKTFNFKVVKVLFYLLDKKVLTIFTPFLGKKTIISDLFSVYVLSNVQRLNLDKGAQSNNFCPDHLANFGGEDFCRRQKISLKHDGIT